MTMQIKNNNNWKIIQISFNNGTLTNLFLKHTQNMVVSNGNHWWGWNKTILLSGNKNIYFFAVVWLHSKPEMMKSRNDENQTQNPFAYEND